MFNFFFVLFDFRNFQFFLEYFIHPILCVTLSLVNMYEMYTYIQTFNYSPECVCRTKLCVHSSAFELIACACSAAVHWLLLEGDWWWRWRWCWLQLHLLLQAFMALTTCLCFPFRLGLFLFIVYFLP